MKVKIIACQSVQEEILSIQPTAELEFLEYSLHREPTKLNAELKRKIDQSSEVDTILLGYGLCSNAVVGLAGSKQKLVIPIVHDCVAMLMGSASMYNARFTSSPDTFYLSRGWIDYGSDPMKEYFEYLEKYGERKSKWLIQELYKSYKKLAFIDTGTCTVKHFDYARQVADFMNWHYETIEGSKKLLEKLVNQQWDEDFLILPPGEKINQELFLCSRNCM